MVGVWIEPVIAQLMMILLGMNAYFPFRSNGRLADTAKTSVVNAVSYPGFAAAATIFARRGSAPSRALKALPGRPDGGGDRLPGHDNCTLKPKFCHLKRLACARLWTGSQRARAPATIKLPLAGRAQGALSFAPLLEPGTRRRF
jgi:hypothetical protein